MAEIVTPQYSQRQLELIRGEVLPESKEEWEYVQDHASDILPAQGGESVVDRPVAQIPKGSDFQDRIKERRERQEDYMRNGS